ncbi:hypothetical protein GCM10011608_56340 [Micromonospora sonchi]|uniref:Peptidase C14 caspase domain-containing protein n=1 Tax=Micromonospora sonchi TaxID=1763543 RepID=A0A917X492_9ACTN|nr:caspase family protein [Micromonospora sonchi]GGM63751.1 hypothetical protein GCM10011608_56340 [Micromonospora sonchi]
MTGGLAAPGTRAVLYGTGGHVRRSELPDLPSVDTTLDDLRDTLIEVCGMAPDHVVRVPANAHAVEVINAVEEAAAAGDGPVLFYYAGHGLLGPRDDLYLATRASRSTRHVAQSIPYRTIRDLLGETRNGSLVVLDCCFSGRAVAPLAAGGVRGPFASSRPPGSFLLTSASHYALSFAPEGERHTLFTGRLLRLLNAGDPAGPLWLTADRLHAALDAEFADDGRVSPARQSEGTLGSVVLARNRAYPAGLTDEKSEGPADLPCPYPGMQPYRTEDSAHFFGREEVTSRLFEMIEDAPDGAPVVLVGASGAGKSSVLRAGLLAGLDARASRLGPALLVPAPGPHPMRTLAEAWARATGRDTHEVQAVLERGCFPAPRNERPACGLLVIDQFEEIFTRCQTPDERSAFLSLITQNRSGSRPRVVLALRADHYGSCLEHPELESALALAQLTVPPLRERELRVAVEGPAAAVGLTVERGLTDLLLHDLRSGRDAHDAAALPFLAHALRETWRGRIGARLTLAGYQATGGIWRSVATTTQHCYDALDGDARAMMRELLLRLVHLPPGGGPAVIRHRVPVTTLPAGSSGIREQLADRRLLTADRDTVQIAHEALLRAWPLQRWIEEDSADLLLRQQLSAAAEEWDTAGRDAAFLYRGSRLQAAAEIAEQSELPAKERDFLVAGQAAETSELRREQRRTKTLKRALAAVAVALCLTIVAAVTAVRQQRNAEAQQRVVTARSLLTEAGSLASTDPRTALRLSLAAHTLRPSADTRRVLYETLAGTAFRGISKLPAALTDPVLDAGGRMLAAASGEELALWDISRSTVPHTAAARVPCPSKAGVSSSVAFGGPDDRMLVATCGEDEVRLWDLAGLSRDGPARHVATLRTDNGGEQPDRPASVAVSPDGAIVAATGWSQAIGPGVLTLWDVRSPAGPRRLSVVEAPSDLNLVQRDLVVFSPDGRLLVTADNYGDLRPWDLSNPRKPRPGGLVKDAGGELAFSPDGELLAASDERVVKLIDLRSTRDPKVLDEATAHADLVASLDFSSDGRHLASGSWDNSVILWNVADPREMTAEARLTGHTSFVYAARFSADGRSLVSVAFDELIRWDMTDVDQSKLLDVIPNAHLLALAPDRTTLAVAIREWIGLWDLSDPAKPRLLAKVENPVEDEFPTVDGRTVIGLSDSISDVAFSSDGTLLATVNHGGTVTLWDVSDRARPQIKGSLIGDDQSIWTMLAFAPNAPLLAVNEVEQVRVWDVSNPALPVLTASYDESEFPAVDITFAPDGRRLLLAGARLLLWDFASGKETLLSGDHSYSRTQVAFSPSGSTVAATTAVVGTKADGGVDLWDADHAGSARLQGEIEPVGGDMPQFKRLAYHPEGELLAGAGVDGTVRLWSVADPGRPHSALTFGRFSAAVNDVVLGGPQGRTMILSSGGSAYVVDIGDHPEIATDTVGMACRVAGGGLTREQWADHVPTADFVETCPYPSGD